MLETFLRYSSTPRGDRSAIRKSLIFSTNPRQKVIIQSSTSGGNVRDTLLKSNFEIEISSTFDCALVPSTTSTETTASDCSPFNSVSNSVSGIVLKLAQFGDMQGRTRTSDVIFHRFYVQPTSNLRIFFATAVHSQHPMLSKSIQFDVLYKTVSMRDLSAVAKYLKSTHNYILARVVTCRLG